MKHPWPLIIFLLLLSIALPQSFHCDSTCPANCNCCYYSDSCASCDNHYGQQQRAVWACPDDGSGGCAGPSYIDYYVNDCVHCTDPQCLNCYFWSPQYCSSCATNYGQSIYYSYQCNSCDKYTAYSCSSINSCHSGLNCSYCYDYYINNQNFCVTCWQSFRNCRYCNVNQCTSCSFGYYLNTTNRKQCLNCTIPNCISCNDGPICSNCASGFYQDSTNQHCLSCPYPCLTCSISTCYSCETTGNYYLLSSGACKTCDQVISYCLTCQNSGSLTCTGCKSGYFASGSSCTACSSPCLACSSSSSCLSCIDYHYIFNNGSCNFCNSSITNCDTCISSSICLRCEYGFTVAYQPSTCTACDQIFSNCEDCNAFTCLICKLGSNLISGLCEMNTICNSNCQSCQSANLSLCVTCFKGFYLVNSTKTCTACASTCGSCLDASTCLSCPYGAYLNGPQCLACPNGTYYLNTIENCLNCSAFCLHCSVGGCLECESPLYTVSPNTGQCEDLCGDGFVVTLPCDGGANVPFDGCAEDCSIEANYVCSYSNVTNPFPPSNATVAKSECAYVGPTAINVKGASQSLFANRVQLVFSVQPLLWGLPNSSYSQADLRTAFRLSPLDLQAEYTIATNPSDGTVAFDVAYTSDLSALPLTFTVDYPSLAGSRPIFQNLTAQSLSISMGAIVGAGRLGAYYNEEEYSLNKLLYTAATVMVLVSYAFLFLGIFSRELAGLEHMLACQTVFLLLLFRQETTFYLDPLLGLRHSLGLTLFPQSESNLSDSLHYFYGLNTESFANNFILNFLLLLAPTLISPLFMLYRIRNKHLPLKRDFGKEGAEFTIGYILLYFVVFNFYGLVSFSYLYFQSPEQHQQTFNLALLIASVLFTLFSFSNLIVRPEVVGSFRSAFSNDKPYDSQPSGNKCARALEACVSWRVNGDSWKERYHTVASNFFFILLAYQIVAIVLIIYLFTFLLTLLQCIILLLLFIVKPYQRPIEKFRSMLIFAILITANLINLLPINSNVIPLTLISSLCLHSVIAAYVTIKCSYLQFMKKCTERSQVVRKIFHEEKNLTQEQHFKQQKEVAEKLIEKYHNLNLSEKFDIFECKSIKKKEVNDQTDKQVDTVREEITDYQNMYTEQRILGEEGKHLRFLKGMSFIKKYGIELDLDIIKENYEDI